MGWAMLGYKAFFLVVTLGLGGCDFTAESPERPWAGYAWHKKDQRFEWWWTPYETHRDCIEATKWGVTHAPNDQWYSEPIGCGYHSNSYWKAWFMNTFVASSNFQCMSRSTDESMSKLKMSYGPLLNGFPKRTQNSYCV